MATDSTVAPIPATTVVAIPALAKDLIAGTVGGWAQVVVGTKKTLHNLVVLCDRLSPDNFLCRTPIRHNQGQTSDTTVTTHLQKCYWLLPVSCTARRCKFNYILKYDWFISVMIHFVFELAQRSVPWCGISFSRHWFLVCKKNGNNA